jgi:outer membrane protein TolC
MTKSFGKSLLAVVLAGILAGAPAAPVLAQEQASAPQAKSAAQGGVPISLGLSKQHYTGSPNLWPNPTAPYRAQYVNPGTLSNSPRLEQLIQNGKMNLSLQDAIALAMENSMDIVVQRYNPWMADASILKTKAGGFGFGVPNSLAAGSTANLPNLFFDPFLTQSFSFNSSDIPVNNPFSSGAGSRNFLALGNHSADYTTQYSQGFSTGTTFNTFFNSVRSSSTSPANFFNPAVQTAIGVSIQQQLLQGFGRDVTRRNILIAENNRKIADLAFAQQAITTITSTINAYWELVYARQNVAVQQQAVTVSEKLYNDNKKQLEIGTMAPLDVTRAESELATDRQNLIVAQTTQLQDELVLKNFISKDPTASNLLNVEIIPTDKPDTPSSIQTSPFADAVQEAFVNRPDVQEQLLNLKNGEIDVKATKNALLPVATVTASYSSTGLTGNSPITTTTPALGPQVVDGNGNPVEVLLSATGSPVPVYVPSSITTPTGNISKSGFPDAMTQVFHNRFPSYTGGINFTFPLRNRAAQADNIHAQLTQRQLEAQMQQIKNSAVLDVRNTSIAVEQGRAQVEAASKARELQQQTFEAEQKKYQLGASTVYNVILTQRDLITAQGTELRALANLAEAKANYERALGRTLQVNSVTIASAKKGELERDTLIPGTRDGQVIGTEEIFKALDDKYKSGSK